MLAITWAALLYPYQEIREADRASERARLDETPWSLRGKRRGTWVAATTGATLFRIGRHRSTRSRELLLGRDYGGILTSDRWRAYDSHPTERRQLCWAHLNRSFKALLERGGAAGKIGGWGVAECARLFRA